MNIKKNLLKKLCYVEEIHRKCQKLDLKIKDMSLQIDNFYKGEMDAQRMYRESIAAFRDLHHRIKTLEDTILHNRDFMVREVVHNLSSEVQELKKKIKEIKTND